MVSAPFFHCVHLSKSGEGRGFGVGRIFAFVTGALSVENKIIYPGVGPGVKPGEGRVSVLDVFVICYRR